jgi:hypothetical protein
LLVGVGVLDRRPFLFAGQTFRRPTGPVRWGILAVAEHTEGELSFSRTPGVFLPETLNEVFEIHARSFGEETPTIISSRNTNGFPFFFVGIMKS